MTRALLASLVALAASCGPPTLVEVQREVFTPRCAGCHGGEAPADGLDLSEGAAYAAVIDVPSASVAGALLVVPGDPEESLLYQLVLGPRDGVRQMPLGAALEDAQRALLREWIEAGAPRE